MECTLAEALRDVEGPDAELDVAEEFPEVPAHLLAETGWQRIVARPWTQQEAIHKKEARGTLVALRRLCKQARNSGRRWLILSDNLGVALALEKGRAP